MKICIITCHDVYNVGASLQVYALQNYLQKCGYEVNIIDYKPDYLSGHYKFTSIDNPKYKKNIFLKIFYILAKFPNRLKSMPLKKTFDGFRDKYLNLTLKRYNSYEELKENPPNADIYIAGSDQIWNTIFKNGRDPAFYLDFGRNNIKRVSYAASFATEEIVPEYKQFVKNELEKFDMISVREISGIDILKNLSIYNGVQVMDPVFLHEQSFWNEMCVDIKSEPYLLLYDFDKNPEILKIAKKLARIYGLKIYSVFKIDGVDKHIKNVGPIEFISYIKNASYVVSNSFHGTCYSIIFEIPFVVINRQENINTRMRDLLFLFDLQSRLISSEDEISNLIEINYKKVKQQLNEFVNKSKSYINEIGR